MRVICSSGPPSADDNLLGMEIDFCAVLGDPAYADDDPGLWRAAPVNDAAEHARAAQRAEYLADLLRKHLDSADQPQNRPVHCTGDWARRRMVAQPALARPLLLGVRTPSTGRQHESAA